MKNRNIFHAINTGLLISFLLIGANSFAEVEASEFAFVVAISPTEATVDQILTYTITVTNTGNSTLGSIGIAIPTVFTVMEPININTHSTTWTPTLNLQTINITANTEGATITSGGSITFTFNAIASANVGITTWTATATSGIQLSGLPLDIESLQPTVMVNSSPLLAPTITASLSNIGQNQASQLSQATNASGGVLPYTFQWFQRAPNGEFTAVGGNSSSYTYVGSQPTGIWAFLLQVADSLGASVNSTSVSINVSSINFYTIVVTQSAYGSISPGTTSAPTFGTQSFSMSPDPGYHVGDVLVDGVSVGAVTLYTFDRIASNHTITAIFSQNECFLLSSTVGGGSLTKSPSLPAYHYGDVVELTATPLSGWQFSGWGGSFLSSTNPVFVVINQSATFVIATFLQSPNALSVSTVGNGSVSLNNTGPYELGDAVQLTANPSLGWKFTDWDGCFTGSQNPLTITINGSCTVTARFAPSQFTIQASAAGTGGSIDPSGAIPVGWNASQTFTITPLEMYSIADVVVDGLAVGPVPSYTFTGVVADHNITVHFVANLASHFINVISPHGSSTSPAYVDTGGNLTVSVSGSEGDASHRWICIGYTIDGGALVSGNSYTFTNVQTSHSIVFNWQEQYSLIVNSPVGTTSGAGWYNSGATAIAAVSDTEIISNSGTRHFFTGWSSDAAGTDATSNSIVMNGPRTATANWKTQYFLTVISEQGNPTGQGWYDAGATAAFNIDLPTLNTSDTRIIFTWKGTAGGYTGSAPSSTVTMDRPITEEASLETQYKVSYVVKGNLFAIDPPQAEWVTSGTAPAGAFAKSITNAEGSTRSILVGDDRPSSTTSPLTVTGTYKTQYLIRFSQNGLNTNVSGTIVEVQGEPRDNDQLSDSLWVNAGESVSFTYMATVENAETGEQYILKSTNFTSPLSISAPTTIQAEYVLQTSIDLSAFAVPALLIFACALSPAPLLIWHKRKRKIIPVACDGGSISPSTTQRIERGGDSTVFIITANSGYTIADVIIDNTTHLGPERTYKFSNVTENHTITATFTKN